MGRSNLKEVSDEFNILQNKYMGLENKHQEEMRLMKLEHDEIVAERSVKEEDFEEDSSAEEDSMDVTYDKPMELPRPTASKSKGTKRHLTNAEYSPFSILRMRS